MSNKITIKVLSIIVLLALAGASCRSTQKVMNGSEPRNEENDLSAANLNGPVKKVDHRRYRAKQSDADSLMKDEFLGYLTVTYNRQGNKLKMVFHNWRGIQNTIFKNHYDDAGKLIEKKAYNYVAERKRYYSYNYDDRGHIKTMMMFGSDTSRVDFLRKDEGRLRMVKRYNPADTLESKTVRRFKNGNLIELKRYSLYNDDWERLDHLILNDHTVYRYNAKGHLTKKQEFNDQGKLEHYTTYRHNEHGDVILEEFHSSTDKYGDFTDKTQYKYRYDQRNNWIWRLEIEDGEPETITTRKITYYER